MSHTNVLRMMFLWRPIYGHEFQNFMAMFIPAQRTGEPLN